MLYKDSVKVGLVIPTLNAGPRWTACLAAIAEQSLRPERLLVVDSASTDQTAATARSAGFEVIGIARSDFNHGGTRQWAAEYLADCDVIVFMTQDALLGSKQSLSEMVACFGDPAVAVCCGRQLPHHGASGIEAHSRLFNYGDRTIQKSLAIAHELGPKVFFCSNSFAAYRRSTLIALGGFRRDLILGEDMEFAARAVQSGNVNMYCATALAYHSHDYSVRQLLARYFDIGVFDEKHAWMRESFGSHRGEGLRFIVSEFRYLAANAPREIPRAIVGTGAKYFGYRLGRIERWIPKPIKRRLSMFPSFFA
jgi:rhamnosyltransferase